ncbi:hypothetical protein YC2023_094708 [Brassica napus]
MYFLELHWQRLVCSCRFDTLYRESPTWTDVSSGVSRTRTRFGLVFRTTELEFGLGAPLLGTGNLAPVMMARGRSLLLCGLNSEQL